MILDPEGSTVVEWTDFINLDLGAFGTVPILKDPALWRDWAAAVIQLPGISGLNPPNPYSFDDWVVWAREFNKTVANYI